MVLDRRPAAGDLVVETRRRASTSSAVSTCSPMIRRLSRTPIAGLVETSTARAKPGTPLAQEARVLVALAPPLELGRA